LGPRDHKAELQRMRRATERQKNVQQAIADIELAAQGKAPSQGLTKSLAIILLEVLKEASRASEDAEYARSGVRALLTAFANDHQEVRDFLRPPHSVGRSDDPNDPGYTPRR
jgi:hypothetical protein